MPENCTEFILFIVGQLWNELNLRPQLFPITLYSNPQKFNEDSWIDFEYAYIFIFTSNWFTSDLRSECYL